MLDLLLRASIGGTAVVAVVWALTRFAPGLSPAARTWLWWCAGAKFAITLAWIAPVPLPVLPAPAPVVRSIPIARVVDLSPIAADAIDVAPATDASRISWTGIALGLWTAGVIVAILSLLPRWRRLRAAIRAAAHAPPDVLALASDLAPRVGVRRLPAIGMSDRIDTPLVAGLRRPVILLPASRFEALTARQQALAICHELAHVARRDLWLGCVPGLAERLFFFHPLARVAAREYAFWREAACDAAVLRAIEAAPHEYGRLLLDLGVSRPISSLSAAGASWSFTTLKRRISMLPDTTTRRCSRLLTAAAVIVAAAAVVPVQLTARRSAPVGESIVHTGRSPAAVEESAAAAVNATAAEGQQERDASSLGFAIFFDGQSTTSSMSSHELERVERLRRNGEPLFWFRLDGREYVIRDARTLAAVMAIWQPVNELAMAQGRLGERQWKVDARQSALGEEHGRLGAHQGDLGQWHAKLAERHSQLDHDRWQLEDTHHKEMAIEHKKAIESADTDHHKRESHDAQRHIEESADHKRHIDELHQMIHLEDVKIDLDAKEIDRQMHVLDKQMRELDTPMSVLDKEMSTIDREMSDLDKEMQALDRKLDAAARRAEASLRALCEAAIANRIAERF